MMSLAIKTTRSLRPIVRQAAPARCMTILSKGSGEEYLKEVRNMSNAAANGFGPTVYCPHDCIVLTLFFLCHFLHRRITMLA